MVGSHFSNSYGIILFLLQKPKKCDLGYVASCSKPDSASIIWIACGSKPNHNLVFRKHPHGVRRKNVWTVSGPFWVRVGVRVRVKSWIGLGWVYVGALIEPPEAVPSPRTCHIPGRSVLSGRQEDSWVRCGGFGKIRKGFSDVPFSQVTHWKWKSQR